MFKSKCPECGKRFFSSNWGKGKLGSISTQEFCPSCRAILKLNLSISRLQNVVFSFILISLGVYGMFPDELDFIWPYFWVFIVLGALFWISGPYYVAHSDTHDI